ncbi:MAG: N-formylglutamate amidohydrolase, partial [Alphaproteobacteria bacterium]|nr:N-formylglutamate amidohydrolase [Alphaproteobacteria bacterium]
MNRTALLSPADPPPYTVLNPASPVPLLFVCEHAGHRVPAALDGLGIAEADLLDHIGWDIGAEAVTRRLAAIFAAPAVVATYSRLVIDANRPLAHPGSIPEESDARPIPANIGLDAAARRAR